MKIKKIMAAMLCVAGLLGAGNALAADDEMITFQKNVGKDFVVLNLSDPQLDSGDNNDDSPTENIRRLKSTIEQLIEQVKPDLITISGDIHYGGVTGYMDVYRYFAEYIDQFKIPWAVVWGNHDNQGGAEAVKLIEEEFQKYEYFTFNAGDPTLGNGNYVIGIEENGQLVSALIMMDTHNMMSYTDSEGNTTSAWAKLTPEQLVWYEEEVNSLKEQGCESTVLITHIPIYAYNDAVDAAFNKEYNIAGISYEESFDPKYWNEGYEGAYGIKRESICSYPEDEGAMDVIERLGSTKLVLCGHDHINAFSIPYRGTRLMYALKTGRGAYYDAEMNGGTKISFSSDGEINAEHIFIKEYKPPVNYVTEFDTIAAIYDDSGKLVNVQVQSEAMLYEGQNVEMKFQVPENAETGWKVKVMLWDSLEGMVPMGTRVIELQ